MPVVPDIAMGIRVPEPSQTVVNPLGIVGQAAQVANAIQGIQARQEAGRIAAQGGSLPEQLEALRSNPMVMGFDPEAVNPVISAIGAQGQLAKMYTGALQNTLQGIIAGVQGGPDLMKKNVAARMQLLPPVIRDQIGNSVNAIVSSITDSTGMPADREGQKLIMARRIRGIMGELGTPSDVINQQLGTIGYQEQGGQLIPIQTPPAQTGESPSVVPTLPAPAQAGTMPAAGTSWTGQPLYEDDDSKSAQNVFQNIRGVTGQRALVPGMTEVNHGLLSDYEGDGLQRYRYAQQADANLEIAMNDFSQLVDGRGFLIPGAAGEARLELGKMANTFAQALGLKPPLSPEQMAAGESMEKTNRQMAEALSQVFKGSSHLAADTINRRAMAVPGISNTPLGGVLIAKSWQAAVQREIDLRNYENAWLQDPNHQGTLIGAEEAFNNKFPAKSYSDKVLSDFGFDPNGKLLAPNKVKQGIAEGLYSKDAVAFMGHYVQSQVKSGKMPLDQARKWLIQSGLASAPVQAPVSQPQPTNELSP